MLKIIKVLHKLIVFRLYRYRLKKQKRVIISPGCTIEFPNSLFFDHSVYVGPNAFWSAGGVIEVEKNVIFGPNSVILTENHDHTSKDWAPYSGLNIKKKVYIKKDVWIGMNVMIMPGVTIGENVVVAAGSVVTKSVDPHSIIAGNPARVVSKKDSLAYGKITDKKRYQIQKDI